jgi:hypothetical protein
MSSLNSLPVAGFADELARPAGAEEHVDTVNSLPSMVRQMIDRVIATRRLRRWVRLSLGTYFIGVLVWSTMLVVTDPARRLHWLSDVVVA